MLEEFQRRKITVFAGGPAALYLGLRANENFAKTDFSSLKVCLSGGAPYPEELLHNWEKVTGCVLLEGWGMSEGAPIRQQSAQRPAQDRFRWSRGAAYRC